MPPLHRSLHVHLDQSTRACPAAVVKAACGAAATKHCCHLSAQLCPLPCYWSGYSWLSIHNHAAQLQLLVAVAYAALISHRAVQHTNVLAGLCWYDPRHQRSEQVHTPVRAACCSHWLATAGAVLPQP
jgi:hypothetical protein